VGRLSRRPSVLVTGGFGQLGRELVDQLRGRGYPVIAGDSSHLDVTSRDLVAEAVEVARPDVIIHSAAWTAVDACELDPDRAYSVNAMGTRHVAEAARRVGAHVCYVSTDYVFDGTGRRPYTEWDATNPLSVYGRSKLGGEAELEPRWTVVRTSWLFGRHGTNFVRSILSAAQRGAPLRVVDDQHGCPTSAAHLAATTVELALGRHPGIHHVTNRGATTWYGLARAVLAAAGMDAERVEPISTAEMDPPRPAPRPAYSVLDNAALRLAGIPLLPDWHEPVEELVKDLSA